MRLVCLGSGSAFTVGDGNWQSNFLLEAASGQKMLIDCGGDARHALHHHGLAAGDIDAVYISHLHNDHIGGLEWLAFATFYGDACPRPRLYACEDLLEALWSHALMAGLGRTEDGPATLATYFDVAPIPAGKDFLWQDCRFDTVPVLHTQDDFAAFPCYGLKIPLNGKTVFLTTDARFMPDVLMESYVAADIILHDCETSLVQSGVHAHYTDLVGLPAEIRRKIWLYHYQPGPRPDAVGDGFLGFVMPGQNFI